jgi:hypothetical protein
VKYVDAHHMGLCVSGVCHVVMEDGQEADIRPGAVDEIEERLSGGPADSSS